MADESKDRPYAQQGADLWRMRHEAGIKSQQEMADLIGISLRAYNGYERGVREIPQHKLIALKTAIKDHTANPDAASSPAPSPNTKSAGPTVRNPVYDLEASAGDGAVLDLEIIVGSVPSRLRGAFWVTAVGDSMEPTISEHTAIQAVPHTGGLDTLHRDGIFLFRMEGGLHIKRLQLLPGRRVRVVSDNPHYQPYEVALDEGVDFEIIGRVVV